MKHRIKYYSNSDLSTGWNLKKIKEVIENYDEAKENYEINDIIEFYNITQFIDNKIYLNNWDDTYVENLKNTNRKIKASIGKYCSKINNRNVYKTFEDVERNYKEDFFKIIEEYKIYNRIIGSISLKSLRESLNHALITL